jgi:hypothetical protein
MPWSAKEAPPFDELLKPIPAAPAPVYESLYAEQMVPVISLTASEVSLW